MESIDCAVVGAGVVGLAVARALALRGREVVILEETDTIGSDMSSRNSEVIHSGIYYPRDSLKARLCVQGRDLMYAYCASHGVAHKRCGKLIVATDQGQIPALETLRAKAEANGVNDLELLDEGQIHALEPAVRGVAALLSPSSGIIDSHGLMLAYQGDAEDAGVMIAFKSPVWGGRVTDDGMVIQVHGDEPMELGCRLVVNCAGLGAQPLATSFEGLAPETIPPRYLAKGSYFTLSGRAPFQRLIYPLPEPGGLGVHLTLDMGGQARFGPDVEWIDEINYDVDPRRADSFYGAVRRYWPDIKDDSLQPGYAGVRTKLQPKGEPDGDFVIQDARVHGVAGLINLYGVESPGLTASLAIAEEVVSRLP